MKRRNERVNHQHYLAWRRQYKRSKLVSKIDLNCDIVNPIQSSEDEVLNYGRNSPSSPDVPEVRYSSSEVPSTAAEEEEVNYINYSSEEEEVNYNIISSGKIQY